MRYAARIERVRLATVASIGPVSHDEVDGRISTFGNPIRLSAAPPVVPWGAQMTRPMPPSTPIEDPVM